MEVIKFNQEKRYIKLFIDFPKRLYKNEINVQDVKLEYSILTKTHTLSRYFDTSPFLLIEDGKVKARCIMTIYPGEEKAYIGFFECENNFKYAKRLLEQVAKEAKYINKTEIIGPVNASFWISYRFKLDSFESTYTNEPYNKYYYPEFFEAYGYKLVQKYYSNNKDIIPMDYDNKKYVRIYESIIKKGYIIESPTKNTFSKCLKEIYIMMIKLYSEFPTFHEITESEFIDLFSNLRYIICYDMVKIAYKDGEPKGFMICIPNYEEYITGKLTLSKMIKILRIRNNPKEYVSLYLGASDLGVGVALMHNIFINIRQKQTPSISALIMEGKVCNKYYDEFDIGVRNYGLYSLTI